MSKLKNKDKRRKVRVGKYNKDLYLVSDYAKDPRQDILFSSTVDIRKPKSDPLDAFVKNSFNEIRPLRHTYRNYGNNGYSVYDIYELNVKHFLKDRMIMPVSVVTGHEKTPAFQIGSDHLIKTDWGKKMLRMKFGIDDHSKLETMEIDIVTKEAVRQFFRSWSSWKRFYREASLKEVNEFRKIVMETSRNEGFNYGVGIILDEGMACIDIDTPMTMKDIVAFMSKFSRDSDILLVQQSSKNFHTHIFISNYQIGIGTPKSGMFKLRHKTYKYDVRQGDKTYVVVDGNGYGNFFMLQRMGRFKDEVSEERETLPTVPAVPMFGDLDKFFYQDSPEREVSERNEKVNKLQRLIIDQDILSRNFWTDWDSTTSALDAKNIARFRKYNESPLLDFSLKELKRKEKHLNAKLTEKVLVVREALQKAFEKKANLVARPHVVHLNRDMTFPKGFAIEDDISRWDRLVTGDDSKHDRSTVESAFDNASLEIQIYGGAMKEEIAKNMGQHEADRIVLETGIKASHEVNGKVEQTIELKQSPNPFADSRFTYKDEGNFIINNLHYYGETALREGYVREITSKRLAQVIDQISLVNKPEELARNDYEDYRLIIMGIAIVYKKFNIRITDFWNDIEPLIKKIAQAFTVRMMTENKSFDPDFDFHGERLKTSDLKDFIKYAENALDEKDGEWSAVFNSVFERFRYIAIETTNEVYARVQGNLYGDLYPVTGRLTIALRGNRRHMQSIQEFTDPITGAVTRNIGWGNKNQNILRLSGGLFGKYFFGESDYEHTQITNSYWMPMSMKLDNKTMSPLVKKIKTASNEGFAEWAEACEARPLKTIEKEIKFTKQAMRNIINDLYKKSSDPMLCDMREDFNKARQAYFAIKKHSKDVEKINDAGAKFEFLQKEYEKLMDERFRMAREAVIAVKVEDIANSDDLVPFIEVTYKDFFEPAQNWKTLVIKLRDLENELREAKKYHSKFQIEFTKDEFDKIYDRYYADLDNVLQSNRKRFPSEVCLPTNFFLKAYDKGKNQYKYYQSEKAMFGETRLDDPKSEKILDLPEIKRGAFKDILNELVADSYDKEISSFILHDAYDYVRFAQSLDELHSKVDIRQKAIDERYGDAYRKAKELNVSLMNRNNHRIYLRETYRAKDMDVKGVLLTNPFVFAMRSLFGQKRGLEDFYERDDVSVFVEGVAELEKLIRKGYFDHISEGKTPFSEVFDKAIMTKRFGIINNLNDPTITFKETVITSESCNTIPTFDDYIQLTSYYAKAINHIRTADLSSPLMLKQGFYKKIKKMIDLVEEVIAEYKQIGKQISTMNRYGIYDKFIEPYDYKAVDMSTPYVANKNKLEFEWRLENYHERNQREENSNKLADMAINKQQLDYKYRLTDEQIKTLDEMLRVNYELFRDGAFVQSCVSKYEEYNFNERRSMLKRARDQRIDAPNTSTQEKVFKEGHNTNISNRYGVDEGLVEQLDQSTPYSVVQSLLDQEIVLNGFASQVGDLTGERDMLAFESALALRNIGLSGIETFEFLSKVNAFQDKPLPKRQLKRKIAQAYEPESEELERQVAKERGIVATGTVSSDPLTRIASNYPSSFSHDTVPEQFAYWKKETEFYKYKGHVSYRNSLARYTGVDIFQVSDTVRFFKKTKLDLAHTLKFNGDTAFILTADILLGKSKWVHNNTGEIFDYSISLDDHNEFRVGQDFKEKWYGLMNNIKANSFALKKTQTLSKYVRMVKDFRDKLLSDPVLTIHLLDKSLENKKIDPDFLSLVRPVQSLDNRYEVSDELKAKMSELRTQLLEITLAGSKFKNMHELENSLKLINFRNGYSNSEFVKKFEHKTGYRKGYSEEFHTLFDKIDAETFYELFHLKMTRTKGFRLEKLTTKESIEQLYSDYLAKEIKNRGYWHEFKQSERKGIKILKELLTIPKYKKKERVAQEYFDKEVLFRALFEKLKKIKSEHKDKRKLEILSSQPNQIDLNELFKRDGSKEIELYDPGGKLDIFCMT